MDSWKIHYKNKYPGGRVVSSGNSMQVYDASGELRVALEKNGAGGWSDVSKENGALDSHCLAPIPKDARIFKKCPKSGALIKDEEHESRSAFAKKIAAECGGMIPSCADLQKSHDVRFNEKQQIDKNYENSFKRKEA